MRRLRLKPLLLAAFALAAVPAALSAQEAQPSEQEVRGWLQEIQGLHEKLEQIQAKALEDPQLSAAQEQLGTSIRSAMEQIDPSLEASMTRVEALQGEAATAAQNGDQARLQELGEELQQIERKFVSAQQQALRQPGLASEMAAFQARMEKKMLEVDPETEQIIARFQELEQKLAAAIGQPGG